MKIGFVGLGTMGLPMVRNLLKAGYTLVVYNRNREKIKEFSGVSELEIADTPAEAAMASDVLFTMLTDDAAVEDVYLGKDGLIAGYMRDAEAAKGKIAVDSSTIFPETSKKIASALADIGVELLDAPVTGSEPQAIAAELGFMVGGQQAAFDRCMPIFQVLGKKAVFLGGSGSGASAKLANNTLTAINLLAVIESLSIVNNAGVDPELFLEVVGSGGARSGMAEIKGPQILEGDFRPRFMTRLMHKDLKLASKLAESKQVPLPILATAKEQFQIACSSGLGDMDMCSVVKLYEAWTKNEVRKK